MSMYELKEIAIIALAGVLVMFSAPDHFWLVMGLLLAGYAVLSLMSAHAFRQAVDSGLVREPLTVEGSRKVFFIAPGCPNRWLVNLHIRFFCHNEKTMKTFRQMVEERNNDTAGAVVMGLVALGIVAIFATGALPLPSWLAALF